MRRWIVLFVVMLLAAPSAVLAQEATPSGSPSGRELVTEITLSAKDLGDEWRIKQSEDGDGENTGVFHTLRIFFGPLGSRLSISVYELPALHSGQADLWASLQSSWQSNVDAWSDFYSPAGTPTTVAPLPEGVNDGLRFEGYEPKWGAPAANGIYALDSGPLVWVVLEGSFNDQSGIPAIDLIAELIVAKAGS